MKRYFTEVPMWVAMFVNFPIGWVLSGVLILALFGGIPAVLVLLLIAAAVTMVWNLPVFFICKRVRRRTNSERPIPDYIPLRAGAVIGMIVYIGGCFLWDERLFMFLNDWWF